MFIIIIAWYFRLKIKNLCVDVEKMEGIPLKKENKIKNKSILIFGGTGHYGRHIVRKLLDKKEKVRILSRNMETAKIILGDAVEIIEGDVTSRNVIIRCLRNVKAIVISLSAMSSKLIKKMKQIERDAILIIMDEAKKSNIPRLVYVSGYDIRRDFLEKFKIMKFGEIKLEIEKKIASSDFNSTILGGSPSFELFFVFLRGNKMAVPGGGLNPIPTISAEDVGEITAQTVIRNDLNGKRIRLTGPEALSMPLAAKKISDITNNRIKHIKIPLFLIKIISIIIYPFNPFLRFIYWSLLMFNNFPSDLAEKVPEDHQFLLNTFSYTPVTFEMEIKRRFQKTS